MKQEVLSIISQITKRSIPELESQCESKDLWDSFTHVELIIMLETEFNIFFSPDEIAIINTPANLIDLVQKKVN